MGKIALIIPNNLWMCPYISIYTKLLDDKNVEYELISWDRNGKDEIGIQYHLSEKNRNKYLVFLSYLKFSRFLKKTIKDNEYDKLIVFSSQVGIFLSSFLEKNFKNRYIFDYRDLSIEQNSIFAKRFKKVLSNSYANIISSPGFKKYLPADFDYVISHNFDASVVKKAIMDEVQTYADGDTMVLTIGALRTDMNIEVMDALGNVPCVKLSFVGRGISAKYLENYASSRGYQNIVFTGYYEKEEEPAIYRNHTFVNIIYPRVPSHISALSNRFYNSLIYKRPMIVTSDTIQGDYVQQYNVGLVINNCDNLKENLFEYRKNIDIDNYVKQCNHLLSIFLDENRFFEERVRAFAD